MMAHLRFARSAIAWTAIRVVRSQAQSAITCAGAMAGRLPAARSTMARAEAMVVRCHLAPQGLADADGAGDGCAVRSR
jgi:hypothetical protein